MADKSIPSGFTPELLEAIRNLVAYYVLRQQLVVLAMVEQNPRNVGASARINLKPYLEAHSQRLLAMRRAWVARRDNPGRTIWKNDWECFPHGRGCRLTHIHTGERIEWDGPDPHAFRIDWFLHHLEWRLENESDDPYVHQCHMWMEANQATLQVIEKAIYCLINLQAIEITQDHICRLAGGATDVQQSAEQLPGKVIEAALNSLMHYRQRQQLAIDVLVDLRPEILVASAQDPYVMPETARRLEALYPRNNPLSRASTRSRKGKWQDVWDYNISHSVCMLSHMTTGESIRWATSDPLVVDYTGYTQHLLWRFQTDKQDANIQTMVQWMKQYGEGPFDWYTRLVRLIGHLVAAHAIRLTYIEKGLLIEW